MILLFLLEDNNSLSYSFIGLNDGLNCGIDDSVLSIIEKEYINMFNNVEAVFIGFSLLKLT